MKLDMCWCVISVCHVILGLLSELLLSRSGLAPEVQQPAHVCISFCGHMRLSGLHLCSDHPCIGCEVDASQHSGPL
jgi:hypothetical protein